jgi:outer membrane receptor protein involved in Fe transport
MPRPWLLLLVLAVPAALCADATEPPETDPDPDPETTIEEEIVVTATRGERGVDELPVSASVVELEDIETTPASAVDELLRQVPGVMLPATPASVLGANTNVVAMRGVGPRSALVLLDGIPVNESFAGAVLWHKLPLFNLGGVEVVRGAATSLWGNLAAGGVINVVTRPIEPRSLRFGGSYGSHRTGRASLGLADRWANGGASLALDRYETDGWLRTLPGRAGPTDIPAWSESTTAQLKTELRRGERFDGWLRANLFDDDRTQGSLVARSEQQLIDLAVRGRWTLAEGEMLASAYRNDTDRDTDTAAFVPGSGNTAEFRSANSRQEARELGGSVQWSRSLGGRVALVAGGLDLRSARADDLIRNFNLSGAHVSNNGFGGEQVSGGLFAQASVFPTSRLEILVSGRLDRWENRDGFELLASGQTVRHPDKTKSQLDPRLAARYEVAGGVALRGAVYRAFRAPVLQELYRPFRTTRAAQIPNPALGPETLLGGEVGLDWVPPGAGGRLRTEWTVFDNEVENQIGSLVIATTPLLTTQPANLGKTRTVGVEWITRWAPDPRWEVDAAYTWSDSEVVANRADPALVGNRVPTVPRDAAQLGVTYRDRRGVTVALRGRHLGRRFEDGANSLALDAHTVLDASVSWSINDRIALIARGENLSDEIYAAEARSPRRGAPRQAFFGARFAFVP